MTAYVWGLSNKDGKAPVKKAEPAPAAEPAPSAPAEAAQAASEAKPAAAEPKAEEKAAPAAKADGKQVYETVCAACHGNAIPGIPHVG
ncbi:hypothetical protein, partial [Escherichia coli]